MDKKKILIAVGGTGGHVFPAQALGQELKDQGFEILFSGAKLDTNKYFDRSSFNFKSVSSSTMNGAPGLKYLKAVCSLIKGCLQSLFIVKKFKPDIVVGFGSFHSVPLLAASIIYKKDIILFESNAWPGKVNRFFSRHASISAVQFSNTSRYLKGKTVQVEVPFKSKFPLIADKQSAFAYFGLCPNKKTLLVFGGSQGAESINNFVVSTIKKNASIFSNIQIIHIVGNQDRVMRLVQEYNECNISSCVKAFENNMQFAFTCADLVICRAGAATISELLKFEVPSVLIPFPKAAENHQKINAQELQNIGASFCLEEADLSTDSLYGLLRKINNCEELQVMRNSIINFKNSSRKQTLANVVIKHVNS